MSSWAYQPLLFAATSGGATAVTLTPVTETTTLVSITVVDNVDLSPVLEATTLVSLSVSEVEDLSPIIESTTLSALVTSDYSDPRLFYWPTVAGYQVKPLVDPLDELHFYEVDTETPQRVAADTLSLQLHTNPVKVDRFGNIPAVYVEPSKSYRFILKNQYGVTKWEASSYTWPNTIEDHVSLPLVAETTTLVALVTSEP